MNLRYVTLCAAVCVATVAVSPAQDPVKVDPNHYKVESENAKVRVLRVHYGPHEKSVMHTHPDLVVVYLSDGTIRMHTPDGKTQDTQGKKARHNTRPREPITPRTLATQPSTLYLSNSKAPVIRSSVQAPRACSETPAF